MHHSLRGSVDRLQILAATPHRDKPGRAPRLRSPSSHENRPWPIQLTNPLDPSQTSSDYNTMEREWQLISAIMAGVVEMRKHASSHLPKFEGEGSDEYRRRSHAAPWRPEFSDIVQTLASKPFGKDVAIKGVAPDAIVGKLDEASGMRIGGYVRSVRLERGVIKGREKSRNYLKTHHPARSRFFVISRARHAEYTSRACDFRSTGGQVTCAPTE